MNKSVDDIIIAQNTSTTDKLDTLIDNLKDHTDAITDKSAKEDSESSDFQASTGGDAGRNDTDTEKTESTSPEQKNEERKKNPEPVSSPDEESEETDENENDETDEYGEALSSKGTDERKSEPVKQEGEKLYTSDDVSRMIRERMDRMKVPQSQRADMQEKLVDQAQNFEADPNAEGDWLSQLKDVIKEQINEEKNFEVRQEQERQKQIRVLEDQKVQAEFESKFTEGMQKRPDFRKVAADMPISNSMMMGIRKFKDPAGFVYAAAKNKPDELKRISLIDDPIEQAAELGRLEVNLSKSPKKNSSAPRIISRVKGDMSKSEKPVHSVDDLIAIEQNRVKR